MNSENDKDILAKIHELVAEEHRLRDEAENKSKDPDPARLKSIEVELDQWWDLLRQRRALRNAGKDPKEAKLRPPQVVENYEQ
jgi:hypothetical protein